MEKQNYIVDYSRKKQLQNDYHAINILQNLRCNSWQRYAQSQGLHG